MSKIFAVYILASQRNGTIYTGVTSQLPQRTWQHKEKLVDGFTSRHGVTNLVYFELFEDPSIAIRREKRLKKYPRQWKINLIEANNPQWIDLYDDLFDNVSLPGLSAQSRATGEISQSPGSPGQAG